MYTSIIAATAVLATSAAALSVGNAVVINKCEYEVYVCNVPAADGGYTEIDKTLQPNDTYNQTWTELTNGCGWSIKLSKDTSLGNIMQYEYTFHNDGTIWYDLSDVNGNPWDGDWEVTASNAENSCAPKQQAYRYATDDAYGMQACSQDSIITVTLCSGESQNDAGAASASSSVAAATSSAATESMTSTFTTNSASAPTAYTFVATTSSEASSSSATPTTPTSIIPIAPIAPAPTTSTVATTFATSTTQVTTAAGGVTVTEVATAIVTDVVTQTWWQGHHWQRRQDEAAKRHEHHARHGHA